MIFFSIKKYVENTNKQSLGLYNLQKMHEFVCIPVLCKHVYTQINYKTRIDYVCGI